MSLFVTSDALLGGSTLSDANRPMPFTSWRPAMVIQPVNHGKARLLLHVDAAHIDTPPGLTCAHAKVTVLTMVDDNTAGNLSEP